MGPLRSLKVFENQSQIINRLILGVRICVSHSCIIVSCVTCLKLSIHMIRCVVRLLRMK